MVDRRRLINPREMLAIDPGAVHRGADAFFWLLGPTTPANARHSVYGDVAIVHVRGSLEHHITEGSDSYEGIVAKLAAAKGGTDSEEPKDPPAAVIGCIDSRGGLVAGLNQAVAEIQRMFPRSGIPLIWYVDEIAASAAYAIACSGHEIIGPASCITGSIGTISTMVSCVKQDEAMGVDVRLITSGARKSDGHPHGLITDAAEAEEQDRVDTLAAAFITLASKARAIPTKKLAAMQAGIFLGPKAKAAGLLDSVQGIDDVARVLSKQRA
jgi:ClpP class serine protease